MKKILLGLTAITFIGSVTAAELAPECQNYFKEADAILENSLTTAKAQGIDPATVKAQYEASKAQLATLTTEQQTASCKQAQEMLEQVKKLQADAAKKAEAAAKK